MVDSQAVKLAFVNQAQNELVSLHEDGGVFHADRRQLVDVEEPSIVDLVGGDAPVGQSVCLVLQEFVEQVEAAGIAGHSIDQLQVFLQEGIDFRCCRGQIVQSPFDHF